MPAAMWMDSVIMAMSTPTGRFESTGQSWKIKYRSDHGKSLSM